MEMSYHTYVFLGDDAFALKTFMIKPYPQQNLTVEKRVYNYRNAKSMEIPHIKTQNVRGKSPPNVMF